MRYWALRAAHCAWKSITFQLLLVLVACLLHEPQLALSAGVLFPHLLLDLLQLGVDLKTLRLSIGTPVKTVSPPIASECKPSTPQ